MTTTTRAAATSAIYRYATVRDVERITSNMLRVRFEGEDLRGMVHDGPDQYVKLFFPLPGQQHPQLPLQFSEYGMSWYRAYLAMPDDVRPPMRTYTIRALRADRGEVDVDFALHGDEGPASRWAQRARTGDEVAMIGPHGLHSPPATSEWQLLLGDETAVPAIGAIVESLAPGSVVRAFVEVGSAEDRQEFDSWGDVEIRWIVRGAQPRGQRVLEALRQAQFPAGAPYAWLAGEAGVVKQARRHLVSERGVDRRSITFTGYWRLGKSEEDTGREKICAARDSAAAAEG